MAERLLVKIGLLVAIGTVPFEPLPIEAGTADRESESCYYRQRSGAPVELFGRAKDLNARVSHTVVLLESDRDRVNGHDRLFERKPCEARRVVDLEAGNDQPLPSIPGEIVVRGELQKTEQEPFYVLRGSGQEDVVIVTPDMEQRGFHVGDQIEAHFDQHGQIISMQKLGTL